MLRRQVDHRTGRDGYCDATPGRRPRSFVAGGLPPLSTASLTGGRPLPTGVSGLSAPTRDTERGFVYGHDPCRRTTDCSLKTVQKRRVWARKLHELVLGGARTGTGRCTNSGSLYTKGAYIGWLTDGGVCDG